MKMSVTRLVGHQWIFLQVDTQNGTIVQVVLTRENICILITLIINILKSIIMHSSALLTSGPVLRSLLGPLLVMKPEHIAAYCHS